MYPTFQINKKCTKGPLKNTNQPGGINWTPCGGDPGSNELMSGLSGAGLSSDMLFGGLGWSKSELGLLHSNCVGVALSALYVIRPV